MPRLSRPRMTGARLSALSLVVVVAAACGGSDGATGAGATTSTTVPTLTRTTLPGGAGVAYPSDWNSFGAGFSGSLELGIPDVAYVSLRDAAASEYLYGPQWPSAESLDEAFDMAEFAFVGATLGEPNPTTVDGVEVIWSTVLIDGTEGIMAVAQAGGSYVSLYAASTDGDLADDTVDAILRVFASVGR